MSTDLLRASGPNGTVWRLSSPLILTATAVFAMSVWLFWDGLSRMWGWWLELPEYSHGILIPPIALFLIWQQKDRLERISFTGNWWGVALVLIGGSMLLLGQLATVYTLVEYAYLVTLFGLVLAFTGTACVSPWLLMPLFILVFMVPLPQFVLANLSTKLQLLSSQLGVFVIRLFDISVFVEGNVIDLGGYKLQVAEACSGLRYLFPLMTLGFLMAYFYKGALWKRVALFLSSIPITVLMNSLRVGIIGVTVEHWGIGMAEGFLHEFQGWMIFIVCAALMLGEIMLLNRLGHEAGSWRQLFGVEFPAPTPSGAHIQKRSMPASFVAASLALAAFIGATMFIPRPAEVLPGARSRSPNFRCRSAIGAARANRWRRSTATRCYWTTTCWRIMSTRLGSPRTSMSPGTTRSARVKPCIRRARVCRAAVGRCAISVSATCPRQRAGVHCA